MALLNRAIRNARAMMRASEFGDSSIPPNSMAGPFAGQGQPGEAAALGISTVLSCVKALHDDMKTIPFHAFTGDPLGAREPLAVQPQMITEPFGPDLDVHSGIGQLVVSIAMRGSGFAYISDVKRGLPSQLMILHPDAVRPIRQKGVKVFKVGGETYGTDEIVHFTGMMQPGAVTAVDVLTAQRLNFELALKVGAYAEGFFGSGGSPSGVISVPGSGDKGKAREVKEGWEAGHGGIPNAHRPAVLFGGATWQQMSVSPENAQFLQTRKFLREEICGIYGVPLQRIQAISDNASQGGGKGLDALDAGYVKHGLLPLASTIEYIWHGLIPGGPRTFAGFDFDVFLRADAINRAQVAQAHRVGGIRLIDEIRAEEHLPPLPDGQGQNPFTPLNSNASPIGGADNAPNPGTEGTPTS